MDNLDAIGNRASRSPSEIIFKTISITTAVVIAAGHLTTLRRISRRDRADAIVGVLGIFIMPTLPFASLLLHSWKALRAFCDKNNEHFDSVYYLSAVLGVRATVEGAEEDAVTSVPLLSVKYQSLVQRRKEYDSRWLGRLIVLLLFCAQAMMTALLAARRIRHGLFKDDGSAFASWDVCNGLIAFGGVGTTITSIGITLLNTTWQVEDGEQVGAKSDSWASTSARVVLSLFDVRYRPETESVAADLRMARIAFFLLQIPSALRLRLSMLDSHSSPALDEQFSMLPIDFDFTRFPDYLVNPVFLAAMNTSIVGILVPPILFVLSGLVGRVCQLRGSVYFQKGNDVLFTMFVTFLNVHSSMAFPFMIQWFTKELARMSECRSQGKWLEIMWVDPWAEKLYAI